MRKYRITVLALTVAGIASAQEDSLRITEISGVTITSAAKKYAEKKSEDIAKMPLKNLDNPQAYTVLPKELMAEQLVTDYQEALKRAPGLGNINYGPASGGVGLWAYSRGFSTFAGSIRNGAATNYATLADPFNTESLEVIKGPSGTLFGATLISYGGLINRVTKKPYHKFGGEISYTTGQWSNNRITADVNTPLTERFSTRFNALYQTEGSVQDAGNQKTFGFAPSFSYKLNDRFTVNLDAEIYQTDRNSTYVGLGKNVTMKKFSELNLNPEFSYASNDIQSKIKSFNVYTSGVYKISDNWSSNTIFSAANAQNNANYLFLMINGDKTITRNFMKIPSIFNATNFQQNFNGTLYSGKIKHQVLLGFDYSRNASSDNRYRIFPFDVVKANEKAPAISLDYYNSKMPKDPFFSSEKDWRTTALYAADMIEFTETLKALLSLRADFFSDKGNGTQYKQGHFSPKVGFVYQPVKDVLSVFANYMSGFKNVAPGINTSTKEELNFKPEKANQFEIGLKTELLDKKLAATVSYYNILVKDIVRPNPADPYSSVQDGERLSKGVEADIITNPINGLEIILGYGYNDSKYKRAAANVEGRTPYGVPKHVGNFWTSYRIPAGKLKGIGAGVGGNFQSETIISDGSDFVVDGYSKLDTSLFYEHSRFRIGLKLNNITNETYFTSDFWGQFQNPRQFLANFTLNF